MDNDDELDEFFKDAERPPFVFGFVHWDVRDEVHVSGVPHYFLLDEDRTVLLHARSLTDGEETIRAILDGWDDEEGDEE